MITDILDKDSLIKINELYHDFGGTVLLTLDNHFKKYGLIPRVTSGLRTFEEQDKLYEQGRTLPGPIITKARGGQSWHNYGLAVDICFKGLDPYLENHPNGKEIWQAFGKFGQDQGCIWGGSFLSPDEDHLEKRYGFTLKQAQQIVLGAKLEDFWHQIDHRLPDIIKVESMH